MKLNSLVSAAVRCGWHVALHVRLQHWGAPQNRKLQIRGTKYLKIIRNKSEDVMLISKKKFCEEIEKAKLERENRCFDRLFPKMKGVRMP